MLAIALSAKGRIAETLSVCGQSICQSVCLSVCRPVCLSVCRIYCSSYYVKNVVIKPPLATARAA